MKSKKIFKAITPVLFFLITIIVKAQVANPEGLVTCGNPGQPDCTWGALEALIKTVFDYALKYVAIPVAVIIIAWGGITMATSAGNEGRFKQGRSMITAAVIGLVIVFAAWLIVTTITSFLGIPNNPTP